MIADRLGHTIGKNSRTMLGMTDHYSHVTDDTRREAARAFARALLKGFSECSGWLDRLDRVIKTANFVIKTG